MTKPTIDFDTWLASGFAAGFIGPPVCAIHDGLPSTEGEDNEQMDGYDPCLHVVRLYADVEQKLAVEANHGPSVWRASNRGLADVGGQEPIPG